jgi:hypothetical protein
VIDQYKKIVESFEKELAKFQDGPFASLSMDDDHKKTHSKLFQKIRKFTHDQKQTRAHKSHMGYDPIQLKKTFHPKLRGITHKMNLTSEAQLEHQFQPSMGGSAANDSILGPPGEANQHAGLAMQTPDRYRDRERTDVTLCRRRIFCAPYKTMYYLALTSMYPELDRNDKVPAFDDLLVTSMSRRQQRNVLRILRRTIPVTEQFTKKEKAHEKAQMHREVRARRQDTANQWRQVIDGRAVNASMSVTRLMRRQERRVTGIIYIYIYIYIFETNKHDIIYIYIYI